jgi:Phosphotransferase enzyme family
MALSNTPWSSTMSIILPDSFYARVLAVPDATGWKLPGFQLDQRLHIADAGHVNEIVRRELNAHATVLYCAYTNINRAEGWLHSYYVLEEHSSVYDPPSETRWVSPERLSSSEQQALAASCLAKEVPELRPPWSRPGWFDSASAWMQTHLVERGLLLKTPIEQPRSWGLSCVLSKQTERGKVYFKVASRLPLFANEPALVQALSQLYPESVPAPIAISDNWLLMTDVGAELRTNPDLGQWMTALDTWAKIQKDAVNHIDHLLAKGCLDRRLEHIPGQVEALLRTPSVLEDLQPEEVESLRALSPRVNALCEQLQHYRVPQTLIHGDFNTGNIAVNEGHIGFLDWTDGAISHPFLDLIAFLDDARDSFPDAHEQLVEKYLAHWLDYEPMECLKQIWEFAEPLSVFYQAISYQYIKATMEQATWADMSGAIAFYLRRAIKCLLG